MGPMGWDNPKCLLPIGETTLLGNILDSLFARGVHEAVLVVGYRRELVEAEANRHEIACRFVENADYARTNTIYSLFLAREHVSDDFVYFNADVWFEPGVLDLLMGGPASFGGGADAILVLDEKNCGEEEVKLVLDEGGRVVRIGKELDPVECAGEFVGIGRFNRSICPAFVGALEARCADPANRGLFFEAAVGDVLGMHRVMTAALGSLRAVEIDTPEDYAVARVIVES
jgi:choline kinase